VLFALLSATALSAQDTRLNDAMARYRAAARGELAARQVLDSLAQWERTHATGDSVVTAAVRMRLDTSLTAAERAAVTSGVADATARILAVQGDGARGTTGVNTFVVEASSSRVARATFMRVLGWRTGGGYLTANPLALRSATATALADIAARIAESELVKTPIRDWSRMPTGPTLAMEKVYVQVASAPSARARACLTGALDDCRRILAIDSLPDPLSSWYAPDDYPVLGANLAIRADDPRRALIERCRQTADASVCRDALLQFKIAEPVPRDVRESFLAFALVRGGPQAYVRLRDTPGDRRTRLVAAAGVPFDSLVSGWRAQVVAAQPARSVAVPGAVTLAWLALFGVVIQRRRATC
jgi:hypothetical protein